ncbi:MAG TPA: glycosyltransferase family 2 protein [Stellaceae bacterium]|nr:glycosyltransferase family 2 protein [Stellaceae bacterium]
MADPARGVSTIVTVYNKEKFLPRVLGAIFGQEGDFPRDHIFIDDGSTDGSFALMEKLCAGRSDVLLIRQRNTGPAKATNAAARHARQPWLKIVDGDDVLAPWCTRLLLDATLGLGTQFSVGGNLLYRDVDQVAFGAPPEAVPVLRDLFAECLRNVPCNLTPTLIGRDRYWEVGGCDERLFTQDFSLLLRLSWRENPAGIAAPVSASPDLPGARVSDNQRLMLMETNAAIVHFLAETRGVPGRQRRRAIERAFGRAWKWQRRRVGTSIASRWFWLYAVAKLAPGAAAPFLPATLDAFVAAKR